MAVKTKEDVSKQVRDLFNRGFAAFERLNLDLAMDLLQECVDLEPGFIQARKFLRAAEMAALKKRGSGPLTKVMARIRALPDLIKAKSLVATGKNKAALPVTDKLLRVDPLNPAYAVLFGRAANACGHPEAAVQTLEIIREHHSTDPVVLAALGQLYVEIGNSRAARECFETLVEMNPGDPDAIKLLKDATALDTMSTDGWTDTSESDDGSYRDVIRDEDEATRLEKESKAVQTADDADVLIEDMKHKIETQPGNVNYYRSLARSYVAKEDFDSAVATLRKALEVNPGDPELDNALAQTTLGKYDHEIEQLRSAGDAEALAAKKRERREFEFNNLQERVQRYPNDPSLRYRWGVMLLDNDYFDEAIQQFQVSHRTPKHEVLSLYYLGLCFREKGQLDMARDQLEAAGAKVQTMDDTKKKICYELGGVYEQMGDKDKAAEIYKLVYQADIKFKDIAKKIESLYA